MEVETLPDAMFDAIIVGGGPAGTAAAISCSSRGLRTLLLEADCDPREQPGETLHPGVERLFRLLGVDAQVNQAGFLRHPGYVIHSRTNASFQPYGNDHDGQWFGYQAGRKKLHKILLERAVESGVQVLRGERAVRPMMSGEVVFGVEGAAGTYASRFVIDATGAFQWLRRHLRIRCFRVSTLLLAYYGWVESSDKLKKAFPLPEFRMRNGGWRWIAPVDSHKHAWVSMSLSDNKKAVRLLPDILTRCTASSTPKARDVTWRIARPCAGPGYFLAGDAACILDPASSHGVMKAVMSGMMVAECIASILNGSTDSGRAQAGYCAWTEDRFCSDAAALISLYSEMEKPPFWLSAASEAVRYIATSPSDRASSSKLINV